MMEQMDEVEQSDKGYCNTSLKTDYTQRSKGRHFGLEVGNITFYIDPVEMSKKSPYFKLLTSCKHFVEGIRGSGCLHEEHNEIACMLHSTCPTFYSIYPQAIRVQSIPVLARLADKYCLKTLQLSCEYFALRANFRKYGNNVLVKLLEAAITYNYDYKLQENLIEELLSRTHFSGSSSDTEMTKDICKTIVKYNLKHDGKIKLWGVCHGCGYQKPLNLETKRTHIDLWKCERCDLVYCMECQYTPCLVHVREQLRSAFEKYRNEELKKVFLQTALKSTEAKCS